MKLTTKKTMSHGYENYCNSYQQSSELQENLKYKKKYRKLKRVVKNLVFENAALCDQVSSMQESLVIAKEERLFLLKKLCQLQGETESCEGVMKKPSKKKAPADPVPTGLDANSKPKSKRYGKGAKRMVQLIPLDVHGRPLFPISLGDLTVYSLGDVITDRVAYHTEDLIYPVGFCSTRLYASLKDPRTKSLYTCKILDGGLKPRFEIVSDTDLDQPIVGFSANECHARLLAAISPMLCGLTPRGAQFFGVSHPTIQNLIQSSPGTRKLALYKPQRFEVSKAQTENGSSAVDEELDPGINFSTLHRTFAFSPGYGVKEEPSDHDL